MFNAHLHLQCIQGLKLCIIVGVVPLVDRWVTAQVANALYLIMAFVILVPFEADKSLLQFCWSLEF